MSYGKFPSPITPIESGGTGQTSVENAKTAFNLANITSMPFTVLTNTTATLKFSHVCDFIMFINGNATSRRSLYMGGSTSTGKVSADTVWQGANNEVTVQTNPNDNTELQIINNAPYGIFVLFIMQNTMNTDSLPTITT